MPNPKKTETKKRKGPPYPKSKQFSSEYQPDPKNVSAGIRKRNAREAMKREFEKTVKEMLDDSTFDTFKLKELLKNLPPDKEFTAIVTNLLMRDMLNPKTSARDRSNMFKDLTKAIYGDKLDVTSDGEKIETTVIYRPEKLPSDYYKPKK